MSRKKNKKKKQSLIEAKTEVGTKAKCWDSKLEISTDDKCPHIADRDTPKIIVPYEIWHQIMALTKDLETEWLGYLGGSLLQDGDWKVTGITVPKQEVTSTTVKPTDTIPAEGVVHSHVNMACFFSGTDDSYLNENHGFSIVVNQREDNKAVMRIELPCGALSIIDADVVIEYPGSPDMSEFLDEAKKNIEEEKAIPMAVTNARDRWMPGKVWNHASGKWETDLKVKDTPALIIREWNQETCSWDEHLPAGASKADLGVPDYNPKSKKDKYKGWDYNDPDYPYDY